MELGNMVFGNSRGKFPMERQAGYERELQRLFYAIDHDYFYAPEFDNDTFTVRPYYWGDCTCGFEAADYKWSEEHDHTAACYQAGYKSIPFDWLKQPKKHTAAVRALCETHGIPYNKGLGSAVHCTCGHQEEYEKWRETNDHAKDCLIVLPNFLYKPSGYQIKWYKYPLRDSYASAALALTEFRVMIDVCIASVSELAKAKP